MQITFEFVYFKPISIWFITVMVVLSPAMVIRDYEERKEKSGLWVVIFMGQFTFHEKRVFSVIDLSRA